MKDRCPAVRRARGTLKWKIILLASLVQRILALDNCHLSASFQNDPIAEPSATRTYCTPSKGCTFVREYADCIRDNETPNCVFFSVLKQECLLCYSKEEPALGGTGWTTPNTNRTKVSDSQKVPPGAKLCDSVPP